jgi:hypothetical protein
MPRREIRVLVGGRFPNGTYGGLFTADGNPADGLFTMRLADGADQASGFIGRIVRRVTTDDLRKLAKALDDLLSGVPTQRNKMAPDTMHELGSV